MTIHVVARFAIQAKYANSFKKAAKERLVRPSQGEPGCIRYELCQELGEPNHFAMIEAWESEKALKKHLSQESLKQAIAALSPMAEEPPTITKYKDVK